MIIFDGNANPDEYRPFFKSPICRSKGFTRGDGYVTIRILQRPAGGFELVGAVQFLGPGSAGSQYVFRPQIATQVTPENTVTMPLGPVVAPPFGLSEGAQVVLSAGGQLNDRMEVSVEGVVVLGRTY